MRRACDLNHQPGRGVLSAGSRGGLTPPDARLRGLANSCLSVLHHQVSCPAVIGRDSRGLAHIRAVVGVQRCERVIAERHAFVSGPFTPVLVAVGTACWDNRIPPRALPKPSRAMTSGVPAV